MMIIGCDFHPAFQQIAMWSRKRVNTGNAVWAIGERR